MFWYYYFLRKKCKTLLFVLLKTSCFYILIINDKVLVLYGKWLSKLLSNIRCTNKFWGFFWVILKLYSEKLVRCILFKVLPISFYYLWPSFRQITLSCLLAYWVFETPWVGKTVFTRVSVCSSSSSSLPIIVITFFD